MAERLGEGCFIDLDSKPRLVQDGYPSGGDFRLHRENFFRVEIEFFTRGFPNLKP